MAKVPKARDIHTGNKIVEDQQCVGTFICIFSFDSDKSLLELSCCSFRIQEKDTQNEMPFKVLI
jgi:hypothetical protein